MVWVIFLEWSELVDLRVLSTRICSHRIDPDCQSTSFQLFSAPCWQSRQMRWRKLRLFTLSDARALTLGVSWLMTDTSSWFWFSVEALIDQVQFPWRWQIFAALGVALLLAASLESLRRSGSNWRTAVPLLQPADIGLPVRLRNGPPRLSDKAKRLQLVRTGPTQLRAGLGIFTKGPHARHFLPVGSAKSIGEAFKAGRSPWEQSAHQDPISTAAVTPTRASLLQQRYLVTTEQTFRLLFHQFYFPPWRVTVDGVQVEVEPATAFSLASVVIPPGTHTVEFAWRATTAVWLGRIVTAIGWLVVLILLSHAARATDLLA